MNNLTYKDFLESEILNFDINWEQRRKYIKELDKQNKILSTHSPVKSRKTKRQG